MRDISGLILYGLFMLFIIAAGIAATVQKNPQYKDLVNPSVEAACNNSNINYISQLSARMKFVNDDVFAKMAYEVLAITSVGAVLLGIAFVWLFSFCPWFMVSITFIGIFVVPAVVGAYSLFVMGHRLMIVSIVLIVAGVVLLVSLCCLYTVFPMVVKLLDKASDCLMEQPGMIGMSLLLIAPAVGVVWLLLYFWMASLEVGEVVEGSCEFKTAMWAQVYFWLAIVAIVWNILLVMQIKTYFIAGSSAQWYFNNEDPPAWNPTLLSIKWALSLNFGSLCISSLVLTLLTTIRAIAEKVRRKGGKGILTILVCCFVNCIISLFEFMTKFATIYMAITGDGFCKAARGVVVILKNNLLSAIGIWWIPDYIMHSAVVIASLVWGILAYVLYYQYALHDISGGDHKEQARRVGVLAFCEALIILLFFVKILLNIVDTLYVTMAIDKDKSRVKRSDVHELYHNIPAIKRSTSAIAATADVVNYQASNGYQIVYKYIAPIV
eukprot:TRINITY_DN2610_c0_g2_i1.p1 TRINITY_DN2610_c0_g2~~TRINITY_DN2610_c0_g2_i1.p1  ORF type:complete len:538 (+),score=39.64 TRINITY_DN2610_c0_g2_i1:130-1614(+)